MHFDEVILAQICREKCPQVSCVVKIRDHSGVKICNENR